MSNSETWITKRIVEARSAHPSITDAVAELTDKALRGNLQERSLGNAGRALLAKELIKAMIPPQSNDEAPG